jgi:hypothetical protein
MWYSGCVFHESALTERRLRMDGVMAAFERQVAEESFNASVIKHAV